MKRLWLWLAGPALPRHEEISVRLKRLREAHEAKREVLELERMLRQ